MTVRAVAIGASAGAVQALSAILPALPAEYPIPVIVVVHLPANGASLLSAVIQSKCRLRVKEAEDKEPFVGGTIYFAPANYHLLVEPDLTLALSVDEPVLYSRPSIDVLFESAADAVGAALVGIVLTGANEDGAAGLAAVERAGGVVLVEDPALAFVSVMPAAALARCERAQPMSLEEIASYLLSLAAA